MCLKDKMEFKEIEKKLKKKEKLSIEEIMFVIKGFGNYIKKKDFKQLNYYQVQELKQIPKQIDNALGTLNNRKR